MPGRERQRTSWILAGVLWTVIAGRRVAAIIDGGGGGAGGLIILGWVGAIATVLATRIVELRAELNGFASVHDLGGVIDLDGNAGERLPDRVVFLPG